jgi:hypothetical protein
MRALSIPTSASMSLRRRPAGALAKPVVQTAIIPQRVSLRPMGNTVAVTTLSDNPFEGSQRISVVTQASGGMAKAPAGMVSKRLYSNMVLGGLGDNATPTPASSPGFMDIFAGAVSAAGNVFVTKQQADLASQQAAAAQAQAQIAAEQTKQAGIMASLKSGVSNMADNKGIVVPLAIAAAAAIGVVIFLKMRKK